MPIVTRYISGGSPVYPASTPLEDMALITESGKKAALKEGIKRKAEDDAYAVKDALRRGIGSVRHAVGSD